MTGLTDPRKQFSKWLARTGAIYWNLFMSAILGVLCYRPETAEACVWLALIVSVVMIFHVVAYTRNSIAEKLMLAMIDRTRLEMKLGGISIGGKSRIDISTDDDGEEDTEYDPESEEEVSNG